MNSGLRFRPLCLTIVPLLLLPHTSLCQADSAKVSHVVLSSRTSTLDSVRSFPAQSSTLQWYDMFANIPHDWVRWGGATFSSTNIPLFVGLTVSTVALVATDDASWTASDRWYKSSRFVEKSSDICEMIGDGRTQFGLAAVFGIYGFAAKDSRALRTASQTVEGILACGAVVQVLKHMTGRESPFVSTAPGGKWQLLPNQIEYAKHVPRYDAYPSGHVATALATVTVVAENYSEVRWIRPAGYSLVGLLAVAMGNTGIHWYSDYPLGLALGYSFGMLVAHPQGAGPVESQELPPRLSFAPRVDQTGSGISLVMTL